MLLLPDHKLIIIFLKQCKEAKNSSLETDTVLKVEYKKEHTETEVKYSEFKLTK